MQKISVITYCTILSAWPLMTVAEVNVSGVYTVLGGDSINENIVIVGDSVIRNYGQINGNISVANPVYSIQFQNGGSVDGDFATNGALVNQIVSANSDLNPIGNLSGHDIRVETNSEEQINFARLLEIGANANEIFINNTTLVINSELPTVGPHITLGTQTVFVVDYVSDNVSHFLANNISPQGAIVIQSTNPFYTANLGGGNALVRQTQYTYVLRNSVGEYLDALRIKSPNDRLLRALDAVDDVQQINGILAKTAKIHPLRIMESIRVFGEFNLNSFSNKYLGLGIRPMYITSPKSDMMGLDVNFVEKLSDNIIGKIGVFGAKMKYDDKYDEFSGLLYGLNLGVLYQDDDWFMHANAVAVGATMKDAYVFDGRGMVDDPTGLETGFNFDVGPVFKNKSLGVTIKPFVGTSADYVKIVKDKDTLVVAKLGLDADLNIVIDNNNYDYGVKTFAQTNGDLYAALYAGMKSVADGVGGNLDVGVLHNDLGFSYKISLEIKFDF